MDNSSEQTKTTIDYKTAKKGGRFSCNSHKQFYLDRVALYNTEKSVNNSKMNDIIWRFESFAVPGKGKYVSKGPNVTDMTFIHRKLGL